MPEPRVGLVSSPDEALPYLISAENDPKQLDATGAVARHLAAHGMAFPSGGIRHPLPVRQVAFGSDPGTLYTSIDSAASKDSFNTTLRWDLTGPSVPALLLPSSAEMPEETQTLSVSPGGKRLIVQRGYMAPDTTLLCDAQSMEPIHSLNIYLGASAVASRGRRKAPCSPIP